MLILSVCFHMKALRPYPLAFIGTFHSLGDDRGGMLACIVLRTGGSGEQAWI